MPGTLAHDGDPLDVLVLGPVLESAQLVTGEILGVMSMDDEKGYDGKIVMVARQPSSPADPGSESATTLDERERTRIASFFDRYKIPDADKGKWAKVTGWGNACAARKLIAATTIHGS